MTSLLAGHSDGNVTPSRGTRDSRKSDKRAQKEREDIAEGRRIRREHGDEQ
jgi:hypothetical protein